MDSFIIPTPHPDPWVDLVRAYVTETAIALNAEGLRIRGSWLDPSDPRDATIILSLGGEDVGLVWDEQAGWRRGRYVDGAQGRRTVLAGPVHLGGGVLAHPGDVARRVAGGIIAPDREYRSYHDVRDGFDDALRAIG